MAKKIIGVVGLKKAQISLLNKKYSKAEFIDVNDNNFFQKKILKIDALVVLYEYTVKKNLSKFLECICRFVKLTFLFLNCTLGKLFENFGTILFDFISRPTISLVLTHLLLKI